MIEIHFFCVPYSWRRARDFANWARDLSMEFGGATILKGKGLEFYHGEVVRGTCLFISVVTTKRDIEKIREFKNRLCEITGERVVCTIIEGEII